MWQIRCDYQPPAVVEVDAYYGQRRDGRIGWTVIYAGIPSGAEDCDVFETKEGAEDALLCRSSTLV
jgi:hypothetical protein